MSRWYDSDEDARRESRREEQRRFEADVFYEVWRAGGDPDRIDPQRVDDAFYNSQPADLTAAMFVREEHQARERRQEEEQDAGFESERMTK